MIVIEKIYFISLNDYMININFIHRHEDSYILIRYSHMIYFFEVIYIE